MDKIFLTIRNTLLNNSRKKIKLFAGIFAIVLLLIFIRVNSYTENMNNGLSDNLIRLHVVANSDSPQDQELKRNVRDSVLGYVRDKVNNSDSVERTRSIIIESIPEITAVAKHTISDYGSSYDVHASLGSYPFPTKEYGDIVLPAGDYQALRIVIGDGTGANWWCVLFPPLCFVDVTHGTVPDEVKNDLKKVLTEEEYNIVTSSDEESDIPVKIKFKIVEMFQDSKIKLAGVFGKLFSEDKG